MGIWKKSLVSGTAGEGAHHGTPVLQGTTRTGLSSETVVPQYYMVPRGLG